MNSDVKHCQRTEIVETILNKVMEGCDLITIGNYEFKDSLKVISELKNLKFLADAKGIIYKEFLQYYQASIAKDIYPISNNVTREVSKKFPQVDIKKLIDPIYLEFRKFSYVSLPQLIKLLLDDLAAEEREDKIISTSMALIQGDLSVSKLQSLSDLINEIIVPEAEEITDKKQREINIIKDKLLHNEESTEPLESLLLKRDLRQQHALSFGEVDELVNGFAEMQKEPPVIIRGIDFLREDFGESTWIYPGLLPAFGVTLLAGSPGSGKTPLAFDAAFSYLNDLPFLGEQPSVLSKKANKRLLILNSDQQPSETQTMLLNSPNVHLAGDTWDIEHDWTMQHWVQLEASLALMQYDVIIVDSFIAIHEHLAAFDESSPGARNAIKKFQNLCTKYKTTVLLIAHSNKIYDKPINAVTGRATIVGACSCLWVLQKDDNNPYTKVLHIPKIKNDEPRALTILFDKNDYSHTTTNTASSKTYLNCQIILKILNSNIDKTKKWTTEEILQHYYHGCDKTFLYQSLNKLEQLGEIKKEVDPNDYKQRLYSLKLEPVGAGIELSSEETEDLMDEVIENKKNGIW